MCLLILSGCEPWLVGKVFDLGLGIDASVLTTGTNRGDPTEAGPPPHPPG